MEVKRTISVSAFALAACGIVMAQKVAVIEVEVENSVLYRYDVDDPANVASNAAITPTSLNRAFTDFCQIGDIVRVNGKAARGLHMTCGTRMGFAPNALPGFAVADVTTGSGRQECNWELYTAEGRFVGRLVDGGFFPHAVQGGAGAFFGAVGEHTSRGTRPTRVASVAEDPSKRRINGGGSYIVTFYLSPAYRPEILMTPHGPAIFHSDEFSSHAGLAKTVEPGEVVVMQVKGLGPTLPGPIPPGTRPFSLEPPFDEVNSPVEVTINGEPAEVLNKIGWPGTRDTYRVDVRIPPGTPPGDAVLQLASAWISAEPLTIRVAKAK